MLGSPMVRRTRRDVPRQPRRRWSTRPGTKAVVASILALGLVPTSASAGTASVSGTTLSYAAAPGETNATGIFAGAFGTETGIFVRESGSAPIVVGAGCQLVEEQFAFCSDGPTAMNVDLGDGDDSLSSNDLGGIAHGGPGDDILGVHNFSSGSLFGDTGDDQLMPSFGVWTLDGGDDDDSISSGCSGFCGGVQGPLTVSGGNGVDSFSYAGHAQPVTVTLDDQADDGDMGGSDNVHSDVENVTGGDGPDTLIGTGEPNRLDGQGGGDTLEGAGGADVLLSTGSENDFDGGAGQDRLVSAGAPGADGNTLVGGADTDTADFSGRSDGVTVNPDGLANDGIGHDNVAADIENVVGSDQADTLIGGGGSNQLEGRGGDDILRGAAGSDALSGGAGRDTADYADHAEGLVLAPDGAPSSGGSSDGPVGARDTVGADVENLLGGAGDDRLVNAATPNRFTGSGGIDTVDYSAAAASVNVSLDDAANDGPAGQGDDVRADVENVLGGSGDDTLQGGGTANRLEGAAGADRLRGGTGRDVLLGGAGNDAVDYGDRTTAVHVIANGSPSSGNSDDGVAGARDSVGTDVEQLIGGSGGDVLTANELNNVLEGGPGGDALNGQGGDDVLRGSGGADTLSGGSGTDTADYAARTRDLVVELDGTANDGEAGELDNVGPSGDVERVAAGSGGDALIGNAAANRLEGGAGDDLLEGGAGPDVTIGGAGFDVASYLRAPGPVTAAINGAPTSGGAADGPVGARDLIGHDIEDLWGGPASDRLSGDGGDNLLYGGNGADALTGGGGADAADYSDRRAGVRAALDGRPESGNDADGPAGARDTLGSDIEVLFGGSGPDALSGNASANFFDAGPGDDVINSRDGGEDADYCGDGTDVALIDELDLFHTTCESVYLPGEEPRPATPPPASPTPPTPTPTPTPPDVTAPGAALRLLAKQRKARVLAKGLVLRVTCSEPCALDGQLSVDARTAKRLRLSKGRRPVTVARGRASSSGRLVLRFTKQARKHLRSAKRIRLALVVRATDSAGNTETLRRRVTLTRKRVSVAAFAAAHPGPLSARDALVPGARLAQRRAHGDRFRSWRSTP